MRDLDGKIALIIGAGTVGDEIGNGRATALLMARHGAHVVCVDRDERSARRTAEMIGAEGGTAESFGVDATDEAAVAGLADSVIRAHGRIDVLDNNVGISLLGGVTEASAEDWDRVLAVNLRTAVNAMKHVIPHMVRQGSGAVVNISSIAALRWGGTAYATYYTSKAALTHLSRTTALEFAAAGVRVNTVSRASSRRRWSRTPPASRMRTARRVSRRCGPNGTARFPSDTWASRGTLPRPRSFSRARARSSLPGRTWLSTAA